MRASHPLLAFLVGAAPIFVVLALAPRPESALGDGLDDEPVLSLPASPRWVAMVGGAEPSSTQVSLAQDAALLRRALGEGGALLFGGGDRGLVQVRDEAPDGSLRARLAEVFDPRDRQVRYVPGPDADGPASAAAFFATMSALRDDDAALTFVLAGHGEGGDIPADSVFYLWGGDLLGVFDLAAELDALARPTRLVVTSCFGGGFADAMFAEARANGVLAEPMRCGVFATRFDQEASGCDPDPRRGAQEGYALHFWPALRGEDPTGARLEGVDLDGDGRVSLLEAHTHARIVSRSLDVPITTSERWLEAQEERRLDDGFDGALSEDAAEDGPEGGRAPGDDGDGGGSDAGGRASRGTGRGEGGAEPRRRGFTHEDVPPELRAEARVIEILGELLDARTELSARGALARAHRSFENEGVALSEVEERAEGAFHALRIRLLERFPTVDDPWHADFAPTLQREARAIVAILDESVEGREYQDANEALMAAQGRVDEARVALALRARLTHAWDTVRRATEARAAGGEVWTAFLVLRACEEHVPAP